MILTAIGAFINIFTPFCLLLTDAYGTATRYDHLKRRLLIKVKAVHLVQYLAASFSWILALSLANMTHEDKRFLHEMEATTIAFSLCIIVTISSMLWSVWNSYSQKFNAYIMSSMMNDRWYTSHFVFLVIIELSTLFTGIFYGFNALTGTSDSTGTSNRELMELQSENMMRLTFFFSSLSFTFSFTTISVMKITMQPMHPSSIIPVPPQKKVIFAINSLVVIKLILLAAYTVQIENKNATIRFFSELFLLLQLVELFVATIMAFFPDPFEAFEIIRNLPIPNPLKAFQVTRNLPIPTISFNARNNSLNI